MNKALRDQVLKPPPEERLELIGELWDSLDSSDLPLTLEQIEELDCRIEEHVRHPERAEPWEVVRARLWR